MSHRKAPLPDSMKRPVIKGVCRWCAAAVLNPKGEATKGTWHPDCVKAFKLIHWPAETRRAVWVRDRGICQRCRTDLAAAAHALRPRGTIDSLRNALPSWAPKWEHDHIRPLIEANGDPSFWALDNIQTLCSACHVTKGKEDNRRRRDAAKASAAQLEPNLL